MTELQRGSVVLRSRQLGIVWMRHPGWLTVLPVIDVGPEAPRRAGDVAVERLDDMATFGLGGLDLVVRTSQPTRSTLADQKNQGLISGELACLISQAMVRNHVHAGVEARWSNRRTTYETHLAGERCVRM